MSFLVETMFQLLFVTWEIVCENMQNVVFWSLVSFGD